MEERDKSKTVITLTGRAPVTIVKDEWPIIATAKQRDENNEVLSEIYVREHSDGRVIVSARTKDPDLEIDRAGELLAQTTYPDDGYDDVVRAIRRVARTVQLPDWLVQAAIADLPPEEI